MISLAQYFIERPRTTEQGLDAITLLDRVNRLLTEYMTDTGVESPINPATGSQISGETEGGFRLPDCPQGAPNSSHKQAMACDIYDPHNALDDWLTDDLLAQFDLYREHPDYTKTWTHLQTRKPPSGHRSYIP